MLDESLPADPPPAGLVTAVLPADGVVTGGVVTIDGPVTWNFVLAVSNPKVGISVPGPRSATIGKPLFPRSVGNRLSVQSCATGELNSTPLSAD